MPAVPQPDPIVSAALGARIRQLRLDRAWSQEQLAYRAGISRNHLQVIERGWSDRTTRSPFNPHLSLLLALSTALEVSMPTLMAEVSHSTIDVEWDSSAGRSTVQDAARLGAQTIPATPAD